MTQAEQTPPSGKKAGAGSKKKKKAARKAAEGVRETSESVFPKQAANTADLERRQAETPKPDSARHAETPKSMYEDFEALSQYIAAITGKGQEVLSDYLAKNPNFAMARGEKSSDPLNITESFQEMMNSLASDPGTVMQRQLNLWGDYAKLMGTMSRKMAGEPDKRAIEPSPGDKRFTHPAWNENHMLDFVKQSYLTFAKWLETTVHQLEGMDVHDKKKAEFYTRQFIDAIAPTNFAMLNPEVMEVTLETKGENLLKGMKNLLEDLDRGEGALAIRQADLDFFRIGENVATTPGKVVFQNEIMQLIQYAPATEEVARRPLLIFPPWINKFYILDLQPANSFIKWMVEQGRTVFVVSWVNPGPELRGKTFVDYIRQGLFEALDAVKLATGEDDVDAIGYCIGGTMLATGLALMARRGDERIKSATFFTAQTDFTESGDLSLFVDDAQLKAIEKQMDAAGGVLEGRAMATTFNMLRSNDLIWSFFIDNYMKGKEPAKFDLLYWNSDATRMPKGVHLFYLREYYQKNRLASGGMVIDGETLSLADIKIPIFMQAGETDHIAPARSVYNSAKLFGGDNVTYMLAGSGHIAGVINHPSKNKYHHSINPALPDKIEDWMTGAEKRPGSWWRYWMDWLDETSPGKVKARIPGEGGLKAIEDAPGSYVKVKA